MAATRAQIASDSWVAHERSIAFEYAQQEREEAVFPAANQFEWLNEHMSELLNSSKFKIIQAFKTPGRLRGLKTPFKHAHTQKTPKTARNLLALTTADIEDQPGSRPETRDSPPHEIDDVQMQDAPAAGAEESAKEDKEPTPRPQSPVQLYTESDIGSPSIHATPEKPLRKGSFTFAPLPARDPPKQSLGAQTAEVRPNTDFTQSTTTVRATTRRESLGLDTDDGNSDDESVDLRAPELIAHEERMKAYESSPASSPEPPEPKHFESAEDAPALPSSSEELKPEQPAEGGQQTNETAPEPSKPQIPRERQRAPKTAIGRPVRPTLAAKSKPQPVPIKITSLSQKPINTAPVAAHNQEAARRETQQPELKRKPSAQFTTTAPAYQKNTKPVPQPKVFALAQKKKEQDEAKAAKEAAAAQAMKERRDNKIEAIKRKRADDEEELERKARENSAERARKHVTDMDAQVKLREQAERNQEHEEAKIAAKKQEYRDKQERRNHESVTKPIQTSALKCAVKPSLKNPPKIKPAQLRKNAPARPPTRLENHEASRPASRLDLRDDEMHESHDDNPNLPTYPSNLSKPPVRASIKKPSIFTSTAPTLQSFPQPPARAGPSMQQYATQKIPFAKEAPPPQHQNMNTQQARPQPRAGINTPYAPMQSMQTIQTIAGTSPSEMTLPEIHTDSSDDSDDNRSLASWATPGHLMTQLANQENLNADMVFPRIPTLSMEEVFQNNPRMARLRDRTSSANWVRSGDALTEMEVMRDRTARAAIREAGGWTYGVAEGPKK